MGELLGTIDQPVPEDNRSAQGFHGLAWDGEYLYGVDLGEMYQMRFVEVARGMDTLEVVDQWEVPIEEPRYLAYDPTQDIFWMGGTNTNIMGVNRAGIRVANYTQDFTPRGAAWYSNDEDGYNLYLVARETGNDLTRLIKMNPLSGEFIFMHQYTSELGANIAVGANITNAWNPAIATMVVLLDDGTQDRVTAWIVGENRPTCFEITTTEGTLEGFEEFDIDLIFSGLDIPLGDSYDYWIYFDNTACEPESDLWVEVTIAIPDTTTPDLVETVSQPLDWAFKGAYPNPFNPTVNIAFSLKTATAVNARVYNLLGQQVAVLSNGKMNAGHHTLNFNGTNLASGMYFLRFEAGPLSETRKLILMK